LFFLVALLDAYFNEKKGILILVIVGVMMF